VRFPEFEYMGWAKSRPRASVNLARSGVEPCPASLLGLDRLDVEIHHPAGYGWLPLRRAIARRYRVEPDQVFPLSGGTSMANWLACAAALDRSTRAEVIVERPTYEQLLLVPGALGCRIRRLDRRFAEGYQVDLNRFEALVSPRTRLAIVTNLHNPSGARIPLQTLARMAAILRRVGGWLVVDEVYLECLFGARTESSVLAGPNVIATNSLTKAYGLDGLRAGWVLGPLEIIQRVRRINDLLNVNGVAPGEQLALRAFRNLPAISRRAHQLLDSGLDRITRFFEREPRLSAVVPPGGNVVFPRLPAGLDSETLARHLQRRYGTLIVPGRFFESPRHVRFSFGCSTPRLERGLRNVSRALDDLGA
jgi:aspartate/methionine/tyrosine aminotransferase